MGLKEKYFEQQRKKHFQRQTKNSKITLQECYKNKVFLTTSPLDRFFRTRPDR
jgi:hypothetical protein